MIALAHAAPSAHGTAALELATARSIEIFDMPPGMKFKAVVAFYPFCGAAGSVLDIPALVLRFDCLP